MDILKSFENLHLLVRGIDPEKIEVENIFRGCILKSSNSEDFYKSWSSDLKQKFPNGHWATINGSRVFINGGKVVAGLDGFNGEIDKFFKEKESKKTPDKPVNERSAEEIFRAKQEIANSMPKPINKMTWKEFKPYGVEMAKQSSLGQPDGFYEKQAKFEHDWAIKNDKSQYATTDKQKQGGTEKETADKKPNHFTSLSDLEKHVTDGGKLSKDDTYTLETKKSLEKKYGDRNPIYKMEASIQEEKRNEKLKTDKLNESEQKFYKENLDSFRKHIKEQGLNLEDLIMDGELESEKRKWVDQNKPKDTKGTPDKQKDSGNVDKKTLTDNVTKTFPNKLDVFENVNHGGLDIRAKGDEGYWISAHQDKSGQFHVYIGQALKDIGNAGVNMNTFYNGYMSPKEFSELDLGKIVSDNKKQGDEIQKELERKYGNS